MSGDDQEAALHESIGWLTSIVGAPALGLAAQRAADYPHIARQLLRWADNLTAIQTIIDFRDRDRHRESDRDTIVQVMVDEDGEDEA